MRANRFTASVSALVLSFALADCANVNNVCGDKIWACAIAGVAVLAAVIYVAGEDYDDGGSGDGGGGPGYSASDMRLKRDIHPAGTLANGVHVYSFRYWNDDRQFVGVMAQDLLQDPRFRDAVATDANGYYMVDLKALHLSVAGDAGAFLAAGHAASAAARAAAL
jgi:hypothetical protein